MEWNFSHGSTRKEKIWIGGWSDNNDSFTDVAVEINVLTSDVKINYYNTREYIMIEGNKELGKDQFVDTLGSKEDSLVKQLSLKYAIENGYLQKVCKRLGIEYKAV